MKPYLRNWMVDLLAVWLASLTGLIGFNGIGTLLVASLVLSLVSNILRPVLLLLSLPVLVLSFGLFFFLINAALLKLVAILVPGFIVGGWWRSILASLVISIVRSLFLMGSGTKFLKFRKNQTVREPGVDFKKSGMKQANARVIGEEETIQDSKPNRGFDEN